MPVVDRAGLGRPDDTGRCARDKPTRSSPPGCRGPRARAWPTCCSATTSRPASCRSRGRSRWSRSRSTSRHEVQPAVQVRLRPELLEAAGELDERRSMTMIRVDRCSSAAWKRFLLPDEQDANRHRRVFHRLSDRRELAGVRVHFEDRDVARILIGGEQEVAARVEREVARRLAHYRRMIQRGQGLLRGIDIEERDAVGAAIRAVEPGAGLVDRDLRGAARALEALGQRRDGLEAVERALRRDPSGTP